MNRVTYFVTGTDTDVGKTVFCAGLTRHLDGEYWKPIQAGLAGETDSETVQRLSGLTSNRIVPEAWRLRMPASPHWAAESEGVAIEPARLVMPDGDRPLVIEGAGGLMVPLSREVLYIDLLARWSVPTILCARTRLGTLNHTLLSLEALRRRQIPVLGVALIGDSHPDNEKTIAELGAVRILGRLPTLDPLSSDRLAVAFGQAFAGADFVSHMP
jgi:dethiobiotin synthetase